MSAVQIARAASRLRAGAYTAPRPDLSLVRHATGRLLARDFAESTVVDVQPLRDNIVAEEREWMLYEDSVLRPPWVNALMGYEANDGVVCLVHVNYEPRPEAGWPERVMWQPVDPGEDFAEGSRRDHDIERWVRRPDHTIDWTIVEWIATVTIWLSGSVPTSGPHHLEHAAIDGDGRMLDLRWTQVRPEIPMAKWETAQAVWMRAITFLNCRNVTLVQPRRSRSERRRLQRTRCPEVTEIQVFGAGRTMSGAQASPDSGGVPLSTVRGHIARYGPKHGRGLLFGKYEGEFWIPAHARGSGEPHEQRYVVDEGH